MEYEQFLADKAQISGDDGFDPLWMPDFLFPFQVSTTTWAIRKGRGAVYADCGLGKTPMALVWAQNVVMKTNRPVLILAPIAVAFQIAREAEKFGIEVHVSMDGKIRPGINVANYERLHYFDPSDFVGAVCDESGCLKNFDGARRRQITEFMRKMRYRLLCTATAAPNEYTELGTSSEALGYLGHMDMLTRFFMNSQGNSIKAMVTRRKGENHAQLDDNAKWRFKGHAEIPFWKWVCSWAIALRKPSDLGFDDRDFALPPLIERQHMVESTRLPEGKLFALPAIGLREQREERRRTIEDRCARAAELVNGTGQPAVVWCQLNDEGDLLEEVIPDAVQISGTDAEEAKEEKFRAFISEKARVLIIKARIGAWGLNFQHCAHSVSFPTHSFEEYYQGVRRFWRFGQKRPVQVDIVTTEGEKNILANLQRKAKAADHMFSALVTHMNDAAGIDRSLVFDKKMEVPSWL